MGETKRNIDEKQEDIMEEIFVRLHIRSLFRFKTLSKNSASLISSDSFARRYHKSSKVLIGYFHQLIDWNTNCTAEIGFLPLSTQGERLLDQGFDASLSFLAPTDTPSANATIIRFSLAASSNSFLLCKKEEFSSDKSEKVIQRDYYVCNPLTRQRTTLPKPHNAKLDVKFDTFICRGDAYPCLDWVTYKVVIGSDTQHSDLQVEIFSSVTGEWLALQFSVTVCGSFFLTDIVAPVMSESESVCFYDYEGDGRCVVLNVNQNTSQMQIVTPPKRGFEPQYGLLCQSQGRIYMASKRSQVIELWELNEDKWIWDLKYSVSPIEIFSDSLKNRHHFLALDPSNSAVALVELDGRNALVDLKNKTYFFTSSAYPDIDYIYIWHPYQWPSCACCTQ